MAGRKRQAVAVIEVKGKTHLTKAQKAARKEQEITVPQGEFIPPETLSEVQIEEFCEIVAWMQTVNAQNKHYGALYCDRDSEAVAQYIICKDLAHEYQRDLIASGLAGDVDGEKHYSQLHLKYSEMARKYASDIGYDYISRMKRAGPLQDASDGDDYGGF